MAPPAILLLALAFAPHCHAWGRTAAKPEPQAPVPRFSAVPAAAAREGQVQVHSLQGAAGAETFLDKMLGTNCYTRAVADLQRDCRGMEPEQKSRLALRLANCQLATQGGGTWPCAADEPLRVCVNRLPDRDNALYIEFLTHADTMCLFIQNQEFEKYTEQMLNRLSEGAGFAREQLAAVSARAEALTADAATLVANTQDALTRLREQRELQLATADQLRAHRAEAAAQHAALAAAQASALDLGRQQLDRSRELEAAQAAVADRVAAGQAQVEGVFGAIGERAEAVLAAQGAAAAAQQALGSQLRALADGSKGLRSTVDAVAEYQRRSDAALIKLLGRSYTLEDAAFYAAGGLAALAAGASRATQGARLPVLALLGCCLVGERALLERMHPWLDVDAAGDVVLPVRLPWWAAPAGAAPLLLNFKWAVRRACVGVGAAALLYAVLVYRDFARDSYRLLVEIQGRQRSHHEELVQLRLEWLAAAGARAAQAAGPAVKAGGDEAHGWQGARERPDMLAPRAIATEGKVSLVEQPLPAAPGRAALAGPGGAALLKMPSSAETPGLRRLNSGPEETSHPSRAPRAAPTRKRASLEGEGAGGALAAPPSAKARSRQRRSVTSEEVTGTSKDGMPSGSGRTRSKRGQSAGAEAPAGQGAKRRRR
jgi:hypothetical protein